MWTDPIITIFGVVNSRMDCPYYNRKAWTCYDGMYKKCSIKRCNRLQGFPKSRLLPKHNRKI